MPDQCSVESAARLASVVAMVAAIQVLVVPSAVVAESGAEDPVERPAAQAEHDDEDDSENEQDARRRSRPDEQIDDRARVSLTEMTREQLIEEGFVFEDTVTQRARAHATIFALTAGAVVPGAGHWHMDDSRTALALLATDLTAFTAIGTGLVLALRGNDDSSVAARRRELWFLGTGLLGTSWLIDIFGTAYRDDLGIPSSSRRESGIGVGVRYEHWRPDDLSLRHLGSAEFTARSSNAELVARTSQELGWGMSDYEVTGQWYPLTSTRGMTRLGLGLTGRYIHYRLDRPFQRTDAIADIRTSLNLGQLFTHLDMMSVGFSAGIGLRGRRLPNGQGGWTSLEHDDTLLPMRMFLALNMTDQLRLKTAYERGIGNWVERSPDRVGVPTIYLTYRSRDRVDLQFSSSIGNGVGVSAGLRFWFGE